MRATDVLIVDDSKLIVKLLKKALLQNSIEEYYFDEAHIFTAHDGLDALDIYTQNPAISLIISDVNMPNLSGNEFVEVLYDTNPSCEVKVIFITTQGTADKLSKLTTNKILGIIHKPFTNETFAQRFNMLIQKHSNLAVQNALLDKEIQGHHQNALKIIKKYLKDESIKYDFDQLDAICENYFDIKSTITEDEFFSLLNAIITELYETNHIYVPINIQAIKHIIEPQQHYREKNPFQLEETLKSCFDFLDPATLKEEEIEDTLLQLFVELAADIADIYKNVSYIPSKNHTLFYPYFSYIIKELRTMDRTFYNYEIQKSIAEYDELLKMQKFLKKLIQEPTLDEIIPTLKGHNLIKDALLEHIENFLKLMNTIVNHYTGLVDLIIWKNAKSSKIILQLLANAIPSTVINSKSFLLRRKKIDLLQSKKFDTFYKETIVVISGDVEEQKTLKVIQSKYFLNWEFVAFSKIPLLEAWLQNNRPTKLIIDYNFKTNDYNNGVKFLYSLQKRFPILQTVFKLDAIYIMHNKNVSSTIELDYKDLNLSHLIKPLDVKQVSKTFLYH